MRVAIQEDMWEVARALPDGQGERLLWALAAHGFSGEDPEPCGEPWYYTYLAFRGRIDMSARQSAGGGRGARARWDGGAEPRKAAADTHDGSPEPTHDGSPETTHDGCGDDTHHAESESESEKESEKRNARVRGAASRFVGRLNSLCGTSFSPTSAATLRLVSGRLAEGYTADDLCAVVEAKHREWWPRADMRRYLRPETLLRASKFEGYLQEARAPAGRASPFAEYDVAPDLVVGASS